MDSMNSTGQLLDLAASAQSIDNPDQLRILLRTGHTAWCEGLGETRTDVFRQCAPLNNDQVSARCRDAGAPWEPDQPRSEAISNLAFALWDASPAAMAYTALEARAAAFGVCLIPDDRWN